MACLWKLFRLPWRRIGGTYEGASSRPGRREHVRRCGGLSKTGVQRVLATYYFSGWQLQAALYVAGQLTSLKATDPDYPTESSIQRLFVEANLGDLLRMHDEGNVQWTRACRFAQKALAEQEVFAWLKTQNLLHGAAPAALQVYEQFRFEAGSRSSR